jgi:hypothetical protein
MMSLWPGRRKVYAFDFWVTLTERVAIRELARKAFRSGHEVHIVSAISPGLPLDNDQAYAKMLDDMGVRFTAIHRVDHVAEQKVAVLREIKADCFWDDTPAYIDAAREAGFKAILV